MTQPFEKVFGNTCELRLIEFLLPLEGIEFNITELSEETNVSRVTVGKVVKKFVKWGILTANNARIQQYSINPTSPIVQSVEILNNSLIGRMLGNEKTQEIQDYVNQHARKVISIKPETSTEDVWPYPQWVREQGISSPGWGAGDMCVANGSGSCYSAPPCATADEYESKFPRYYQ